MPSVIGVMITPPKSKTTARTVFDSGEVAACVDRVVQKWSPGSARRALQRLRRPHHRGILI